MIKIARIYLDNNSSTIVDDRVIEAMIPYFNNIISPPSSDYGHSFGIEAQQALNDSRKTIADKINAANIKEIVFTSGQSESNNFIVKGIAFHHLKRKKSENEIFTVIASSTSHSTILESMESLKFLGINFKKINVDSEGFVIKDHLIELLESEPNPILVSIPHGNVEIGTVENLKELADVCHKYNVPLHADATYSFCKVPIDVQDLAVDMLTLTSHLIHGPKGVGAVYINKKVKIERLLDGGLQENRKRAGTENIPGIVGFAKAVSLYTSEVVNQVKELRDHLWRLFNDKITDFQITGPIDPNKRIPNHFSAVINYIEGESILLHLDMLGFMIATGSACSSKRLTASHVLTAIGLPIEISHGSIRIAVSKYNTKEEIDQFIEHLAHVVARLRQISPVDKEFMEEYRKMKEEGLVDEEEDHFIDLEDE